MLSNSIIIQKTPLSPLFSDSKKGIRLSILFGCCFLSSLLGGTVSTLMSVYLPVVVKEMAGTYHSHNLDNIGAFINAIFIYGWMVGGMIWGLLCDRKSRKSSFLYATLCYGIFTLAIVFASTWVEIVVFRFLAGFGVGGVVVTTTILISEAFEGKKRAIILGILSISFPLGIFSAGAINFFIADWRYGFTIGLIPIFLAVFGFKLIPAIIKSKGSSKTTIQPERMGLFSPLIRRNLWAGSLIFGTALIGLWATFSWLPSWIQSIALHSDGQKERGMAMMLLGGGGLLGGLISGWIVNIFGVHKTMMGCFAACFILCWTLFKLSTLISPGVYLQIALLALFFGVSQGCLSVYIPQLFPPFISATATGFCFNIGRLVTATAVFFIGSLIGLLGGYGHTIFDFSFVFLIGWGVTLFFKSSSYSPSL
ncbi:MAG: MFS transporter [Chitinophagaceae bacterium]